MTLEGDVVAEDGYLVLVGKQEKIAVAPQTDGPVSYTHLTLPTIYSV